MIRQIFLRSRERNDCLKRDNYTCQVCGGKQSKAKGKEFKVEVHHIKGVKVWDEIIKLIYNELLCNPEYLITLCRDCHMKVENNIVKLDKEIKKEDLFKIVSSIFIMFCSNGISLMLADLEITDYDNNFYSFSFKFSFVLLLFFVFI